MTTGFLPADVPFSENVKKKTKSKKKTANPHKNFDKGIRIYMNQLF